MNLIRRVLRPMLSVFGLMLVVSGLTSCGNAETQRLILTGSSTVAPLISEIARRFENLNPDIRVDVQTGGSSRGVNDARKGLANIGMVSRDLKTSEQDLKSSTIAWDGITIILHRDNPVSTLTRQQVIDIYNGEIDNWQQAGGKDQPIVVVNKAQGRSTLELFLQHFELKHRQINADIIVGDNQQGLKTVAGNPMAIGYVSIGAAAYEVRHGAAIKLLAIDGIDATLGNVEQGLFPISRPLNLVTAHKPSPLEQRFIKFARSSTVVDIVRQHYFIPVYAP